jgi:hypothetical protein
MDGAGRYNAHNMHLPIVIASRLRKPSTLNALLAAKQACPASHSVHQCRWTTTWQPSARLRPPTMHTSPRQTPGGKSFISSLTA